MDVGALLDDMYGRVPELVRHAVEGLSPADLVAAPREGANTIGWLVWHLARVVDHHGSELIGGDQLWVSGDWAARFGLEPEPNNTGYGHSASDVASVRPSDASACIEYADAVTSRLRTFVSGLDADALDRIVDRRWDPPVTMGVRLVSIADDCLQHAGQASYARGLLRT